MNESKTNKMWIVFQLMIGLTVIGTFIWSQRSLIVEIITGLIYKSLNIKPIHRLPQPVWYQLESDLYKGRLERGHNLKIDKIYEVINPTFDVKFNTALTGMNDPNIQQLYHGTGTTSILGICQSGFKLPSKTSYNMFGPGIYLAKVPQKSSDYTDTNGYIFICDVAIGRTKTVRKAKSLSPGKDLKKSYLFGLVKREYDAAHAPAGCSTISDEYIVFNPNRIKPKYIIATTRC